MCVNPLSAQQISLSWSLQDTKEVACYALHYRLFAHPIQSAKRTCIIAF